jgi:hypothetical protein
MSSWTLLRYLTPFWDPPVADPIFGREQVYPPVWRKVAPWAARAVRPALLALGGLYILALVVMRQPANALCTFGVTYMILPLFALVPSLLLWTLPLGVALGPIIVREREGGTWDALRTIPLDTGLIVLSKTRGALWPLRDLMAFIRNLLAIVAMGVGAFGLIVIAQTLFGVSNALPLGVMCVVGTVLAAAGAVVFLADWAQQFVLMGVTALAVSASAPSQRVALPGAIVAAFVAWGANAGLAWLALLALPGHSLDQPVSLLPPLVVFGPPVLYILVLPPFQGLALVLATFMLREVAIRQIWRWALRAATHD